MEIVLDKEQREIKNHGSYEFPLRISHERLLAFQTGSFPLHWHPEIELTLVLEGEICYQVNEKLYHLREGDVLFCNCNALHAGGRADTEDCHYLSVTFHPRLLYGYSSSTMDSKFIAPIIGNRTLSSVCMTGEEAWMREVTREMREILVLFEDPPETYELQLLMKLLKIWLCLYEHEGQENETVGNVRDTERIRKIIRYIHGHYPEQITLESIAEQVHLCRGESCRMFKRYMNETVFEYLLRYRIERSLELLKDSSMNITQIAEKVGFVNPGYFTRVFRQYMKETPMQYRKKIMHRTSREGEEGES